MPIRREHRFFYPIDWPQLSAVFGAASGGLDGVYARTFMATLAAAAPYARSAH
jgi:hypothetical protein